MNSTIEKVWITTAGLRAVVLRHAPSFENSPMNFRCGYVEVPKSNKYFGKHYDDLCSSVHGGLTYSTSASIQNYPVDFNSADTWWFGYDCGHYGDDSRIQDLAYCIAECEDLAVELTYDCEE